MKKVYYYFHAGSGNHGCEAIVRATTQYLDKKPVLITNNAEEDIRYGINHIVDIKKKSSFNYNFIEKVLSCFTTKVLHSEKYGYSLVSKYESCDIPENAIAMSIGGDNYCYGLAYNLHLAALNKYLHKHNVKTVLWGCSIEPSTVTSAMKKDFAKYDLIVVREDISYQFLKKCNRNTIKVCDPAFTLKKQSVKLPEGFIPFKIVGINISPLIQKKETKTGITFDNYKNMIRYILDTTDYQIALIPHVVSDGNDDRVPLQKLMYCFSDSKRICMIEDADCEQLKGYISNCSLFIGARTHATIAAYSTEVPTLVIGYSTKAIGIARELFGTDENYVLPVQKLTNSDDMIKAFQWLDEHKFEIREHLKITIPIYKNSIDDAYDRIEKL